ncbi:hypothetical protein GEMRC1_010545 [Eukaryota sp. GEM-RC1]
MHPVTVLDVKLLNNPAKFLDPYTFEIVFEADQNLTSEDMLEFKFIYVGSAKSTEHDQELEVIEISPIPAGVNRFSVETDAPDGSQIPLDDLLGNTVILVMCYLNKQEITRVGFFVNVHYEDPDMELDEPDFSLLLRNVNTSEPRITVQ